MLTRAEILDKLKEILVFADAKNREAACLRRVALGDPSVQNKHPVTVFIPFKKVFLFGAVGDMHSAVIIINKINAKVCKIEPARRKSVAFI